MCDSPEWFFSDMAEFYNMAKKGNLYLFGDGEQKTNPIHGEDLAAICIRAIDGTDPEIIAGGPETLTYNQITTIAFEVAGKTPKITRIPDWARKIIPGLVRNLLSSKFYGPI